MRAVSSSWFWELLRGVNAVFHFDLWFGTWLSGLIDGWYFLIRAHLLLLLDSGRGSTWIFVDSRENCPSRCTHNRPSGLWVVNLEVFWIMVLIGLLKVYVGCVATGVIYVDVWRAKRLGKFRLARGCVPERMLESLLGLKRGSFDHTLWQLLFNLAYPTRSSPLCCRISQPDQSGLAIKSCESLWLLSALIIEKTWWHIKSCCLWRSA